MNELQPNDSPDIAEASAAAMAMGLIKSMRPHQWVKNSFVFAPLVFSSHLLSVSHSLRAAAGVLIFCGLSGAVYLLNDIIDVDKDRAHPTKCKRPIPAGVLPIGVAKWSAGVIGVGCLGAGFALDWRYGLVALAYLANNWFYSTKIKNVVGLDVLSIATGFLFRTLAGAFAISVAFSEWLFACTFLLALYLALGKRTHEVIQAGEGGGKQRKVLEHYNAGALKWTMLVVAVLTVLGYGGYVLSVAHPDALRHTAPAFASPYLPYTIPFAFIGIGRFYQLVRRTDDARSPTDRMIRDPVFVANLGLWAASIVVLIYGQP